LRGQITCVGELDRAASGASFNRFHFPTAALCKLAVSLERKQGTCPVSAAEFSTVASGYEPVYSRDNIRSFRIGLDLRMKALQINEDAEMKKADFFKPAFLFNLVPRRGTLGANRKVL
jgi:hypothetical protein